ncbi:MAG: hypothetical protein V7603_6309 [Micromonosporaceae bacterium]
MTAVVDVGAGPTAVTHDDDTPLGWARYNQQHAMVGYLAGRS